MTGPPAETPELHTTTLRRFHVQRNQTWRTPSDVYAALDAEFHFTLDPCRDATIWDGLAITWKTARVYCNPPYNNIKPWLAKAREAALAVYLLPARTGTDWWAEYAIRAAEVRFIRGRLTFDGVPRSPRGGGHSPEWSVILVYRAGA